MDNIIIEKVINNNIISAYEKSGAEVIVMGRGNEVGPLRLADFHQ